MVYVLFEANRLSDVPKADKIWALLSDVYTVNSSLLELDEDRRKSYAAELTLAAWKAREDFLTRRQRRQPDTFRPLQRPTFIAELENKLSDFIRLGNPLGPNKRKPDQAELLDTAPTKRSVPTTGTQGFESSGDNLLSQLDLDTIAYIDFDNIDWSFWEAPN